MLDNNSMDDSSLLYCDEDPLVVSTTPPPQLASSSCVVLPPQQQAASVVLGDDAEEKDHLKELLVDHMARQRSYAPTCREGYLLEHLLPRRTRTRQQQQGSTPPEEITIVPGSVSGARSGGVHYIIYAFGRLGLTVATVFNAVNYLDRFLSINCHLRWEAWMVELVSVACLSIACKLDEVNIPSLHHLQMEEVMSHSFLPATVRDMELTLLKALQWRLACVTPHSFLHLLLPLLNTAPHTTAAWTSRCTRLLIRSLAEPSFIQFDASVIASSALRCVALQDQHHHNTDYGGCIISRLVRPDCPATAMDGADDADECFRLMKTLYDDASCRSSESAWNWWNTHRPQLYMSSDEQLRRSPGVSVIRRRSFGLKTAGGGGSRRINSSRSAVISRRRRRRRLFGSSASTPAPAPQAGGKDSDDTTDVRDEDISHTQN